MRPAPPTGAFLTRSLPNSDLVLTLGAHAEKDDERTQDPHR